MKQYDKVIFVSMGNASRSVMAEQLLKKEHLMGPLDIYSAGLVVLFAEPINALADEVLRGHGLEAPEHVTKALTEETFGPRNLILTMDEGQKQKIFETFGEVPNVYTLPEFIGRSGDVMLPHGKGIEAYFECFQILRDMIHLLAVELNEEELMGV
ncbi:MAG: hypothetical protein SPL15_06685 [Lachnospiraceae bacterium]|nr:hypothetical protein [Lachnospiraceae bacterium]MDY5742662.1 hypothetical protein [Lachnospiraceae bacterium]